MKKIIFLLLVVIVGCSFSANAQVPIYQYSGTHFILGVGFNDSNYADKCQSIYYPTDFPGMPEGNVTAIYFRIFGNLYGTDTVVYPFFTTKIGYCKDSTYPHRLNEYDTFKTGLTPIYGPATFTIVGADSVGRWVKVPVVSGTFRFSHEQKFVVEFAMGPKYNFNGINISSGNAGVAKKYRTIGGPRDSVRVLNGTSINPIDLGLDIAGVGISQLSNIKSFGLFPNPSANGRFYVSFDTKQGIQNASITITNVTGQEVYKKTYLQPGNSFFNEVNLGGAAKGIYFMELRADGERIVRRVVLE